MQKKKPFIFDVIICALKVFIFAHISQTRFESKQREMCLLSMHIHNDWEVYHLLFFRVHHLTRFIYTLNVTFQSIRIIENIHENSVVVPPQSTVDCRFEAYSVNSIECERFCSNQKCVLLFTIQFEFQCSTFAVGYCLLWLIWLFWHGVSSLKCDPICRHTFFHHRFCRKWFYFFFFFWLFEIDIVLMTFWLVFLWCCSFGWTFTWILKISSFTWNISNEKSL